MQGFGADFRSCGKQVEARRQLEVEWNQKQNEKFKTDENKKQEISLVKERKRLNKLEDLKLCGGPFTNSGEVAAYLRNPDLTEKQKQQ